MDTTALTNQVAHLFEVSGHVVKISARINHREIDVYAEQRQGLIRQTILVECADYAGSVGVSKLQEDFTKLRSAKEKMSENVLLMHVARSGYSPDASGYAIENGLPTFSLATLTRQLVNFDAYVNAVENDKARRIITNEYQPTKIHFDGRSSRQARPAIDFIDEWLASSSRWLTILGDYGVGKSWMLKRFLYYGIEKYKENPEAYPLPFFVPLQHFTKAFDYQNMILRTFQLHGLAGVPYLAFEHLAMSGRILFLFDSFDEMAQHLNRDTIRENLKELLVGMSGDSRAIMTSRPTYFESRAERLLAIESDGSLVWHPLDRTVDERRVALSGVLSRQLEESQFARLMDLSLSQRRRLFAIVLGARSRPYAMLNRLLKRFEELGSLSQRAVIARLLTTVAETLSSGERVQTIEGYPLIPDDLKVLNQGKIFEIVIYNLLYRDSRIGDLSAADRYRFLKAFAIYLQHGGQWSFAEPGEIRALVENLFRDQFRRSDTREQLLERYYRTCRRHSGLTTEGQFQDSTGQLDLPVESTDSTSRVGFSHNSLREYLVADAFADHIMNGSLFWRMNTVNITDTIVGFFADFAVYMKGFPEKLRTAYVACTDSNLKERLFRLLFGLVKRDAKRNIIYLGRPAELSDLDLSNVDFSGLPLVNADFARSILPDTDLRDTDLREASFSGAVLDGTMLDRADIESADFSKADIVKIFVLDEFDTNTSSMLSGRSARQWIYSHGGVVDDDADLNPLLGEPWYEAAREVTKTLERRIAGTHQDRALSKGTKLNYREFAIDFVTHLQRCGILEHVKKARHGATVVRVAAFHRDTIREFNERGTIDEVLQSFFDKQSHKHGSAEA